MWNQSAILFRLVVLAALPAATAATADAAHLNLGTHQDADHQHHRDLRGKKTVKSNCKVTDSTDVAVYVGDGTGASSRLWAEALVDFWRTGRRVPGGAARLNAGGSASGTTFAGDPDLEYVTLSTREFEACSAAEFFGLDFFFMPGGSAYEIQDALQSEGKDKLTAYLDNGGSYVGMCAGGYYATRGYYWKGYDGAPTDNCKDKFCRYETSGTYSFSSATEDFTVHEWNGRSYHSDLLAYGPLAQVLVEGPIEEIAGPWRADSDPDAPYDSHLLRTDDPAMPYLRSIYWGGATEGYVHTSAAAAAAWGTEHAHFVRDAAGGRNDDLVSPADDGALWPLVQRVSLRGPFAACAPTVLNPGDRRPRSSTLHRGCSARRAGRRPRRTRRPHKLGAGQSVGGGERARGEDGEAEHLGAESSVKGSHLRLHDSERS